jgi:hypothetical protein
MTFLSLIERSKDWQGKIEMLSESQAELVK